MLALSLAASSRCPSVAVPQAVTCAPRPVVVRSLSTGPAKLKSAPMVYISGEEMTKYCMDLILDKWIKPHINIDAWRFYDLSCRGRDNTDDKVLHDAVAAGKEACAIFKEPTITPTVVQKQQMGLKKAYGSPNGAMRRGWNGFTISRDTIHIPGVKLGYERPVFFDRHAIGGEYGAGWKSVGQGTLKTVFTPADGSAPIVVDERKLVDKLNAAVTYHNPYDNVVTLGHHFFGRCLAADIRPYVTTKRTVFQFQNQFWDILKDLYDREYKDKFASKNICKDLQHIISDAATMQLIRWTQGGFGMVALNYDGDLLTDELAQVHKSPGFITSNLHGVRDDGVPIHEYEASHGTVADMWEDHKNGKETSLNPLGMVEALVCAMSYAAELAQKRGGAEAADAAKIIAFSENIRKQVHKAFVDGKGTRDLCGPSGLTTEQFVAHIAKSL